MQDSEHSHTGQSGEHTIGRGLSTRAHLPGEKGAATGQLRQAAQAAEKMKQPHPEQMEKMASEQVLKNGAGLGQAEARQRVRQARQRRVQSLERWWAGQWGCKD